MGAGAVIGVVVALVVAVAVGFALRRRRDDRPAVAPTDARAEKGAGAHAFPDPPPRAWASDTITPQMLGPRGRAPQRVGGAKVLSQGVTLAVEMARVDGDTATLERRAIREFLLAHAAGLDESTAERVIKEGFEQQSNTDATRGAIETIRALANEDQRQFTLRLLAHVARADGRVSQQEHAFMVRVGQALGIDHTAVDQLLR